MEIPEPLGKGDRIAQDMWITNDSKTVKALISGPGFKSTVGTLEFNALEQSRVVVYSKEQLPVDCTPEQFLVRKLYQVELLEMCFWLHDNACVNDEIGFLYYADDGGFFVTSNYLSSRFSTSHAEFKDISLSRDRLRDVRKLFRSAVTLPDTFKIERSTQLVKGTNRLNRCLFHIQAARATTDLALKVTCYCSALEALFASSQAELSHQLSERVAVYLASDAVNRKETFSKMKKAYAIRSKITHGDVVRASHVEAVAEASQFCDQILRTVVMRILESPEHAKVFESPSEELDSYFLGLLLDDAPKQT